MKANNNNLYKNDSGYYDGTAGRAIAKITKKGKIKARNREKDVTDVMSIIKRFLDITDFKLENRLILLDKQTGKRHE